jgi:electron transport complex protein RnfG
MNPDARERATWGAIALAVLALACLLLIAAVHSALEARIARNEQLAKLRVLDTVMPLAHDNDLYSDTLTVVETGFFPRPQQFTAYRARQGGMPVGVVLMPISVEGYNDLIRLAIGISADGIITGVRVMEHRETEGLGSGISAAEWLTAFNSRGLENPPEPGWTVRAAGGEFDQLSGATISPRAVIHAVKDSLAYFAAHREQLFEQ